MWPASWCCGQLILKNSLHKQFSSKIYKNKINKRRTVYLTRDVKRVWNSGELAWKYTRWAKVARFPTQHSISLLKLIWWMYNSITKHRNWEQIFQGNIDFSLFCSFKCICLHICSPTYLLLSQVLLVPNCTLQSGCFTKIRGHRLAYHWSMRRWHTLASGLRHL